MTQETSLETTSKKRRLIWVTGGKGGVGKSTFARGLLDLSLKTKRSISAFDADPNNPQLLRYYKNLGTGVQRVNFDIQGDADILVEQMEEHAADVLIVDAAAGSNQLLLDLENDVGLLSEAPKMGYTVTVVSVLSRIKDSISLLKATLAMTEDFDVQHVAVKNLYFGTPERFRLFDGSKTKAQLLEQGGWVLDMPELFDDTYEQMDQLNLPFCSAVERESGLSRAHRTRVYRWLQLMEAELKQAKGKPLGL